jgi:uncharacterized protein YdhG (YjbR/CyaY superfamily)
VTSQTPDVQSYLSELPAARRTVLEQLRGLCLLHLEGYEECMSYGLPGYRRNGIVEVAFASQKQYVALYVLKKEVLDEFRAALAGASLGKGCIRFSNPARMDFNLLARMLRRNSQSAARVC